MLPKSLILIFIVFTTYLIVFVLVKQFPENFYNIRKVTIGGIVPSSNEASKITIHGNHFYVNGEQFELRAVYYYQPNAYHSYFWDDLNLTLMEEDFKTIKSQGFNAVSIRVGWGSFMPTVDLSTMSYTNNSANEQKLLTLVDKAKSNGLYVMFWLDYSRLPEGIGLLTGSEKSDLCGISRNKYYGFVAPCIQANSTTNGPVWQLLLKHYKILADLLKDKDNIIWDPLDWQHLNLNVWSYGDDCELQQWRSYLQKINSSISYWNERWNETNNNWNVVLFPIDDYVKGYATRNPTHQIGIAYGAVNVTSSRLNLKSKYKWEDFRKYQNQILINNTRDITSAIKTVDTDAIIGQRIDRWRYNDWRNETWGVPYVDFIFEAYNPSAGRDNITIDTITGNITERINRVRNTTNLPIYLSDSQVSSLQFTEEGQKTFFVTAYNTVHTLDLAGIGIWQWRENCLNDTSSNLGWGLIYRDGRIKPALIELVNLFGGNLILPTTSTTTTTTQGGTTGGGTTAGVQTTSTTSYTITIITTTISSQTTTTSSTSEITTATSSASPISFSKIDYTIVALALTAVIAPILIFVFIKTI
jgi:hypothetical protein